MKRKSICLLPAMAACLAPSVTTAAGEDPGPSRVCLGTDRLDDYENLPNFKFSGTVTGNDSSPHFGYWVLALDASDNYWAQNGGDVIGDGGEVKFGVSNISTYPLKFIVARVSSEADFKELRNLARFKRAVLPKTLSNLVMNSPYNGCIFEFDNGDRKTGTPVNKDGKCRCA